MRTFYDPVTIMVAVSTGLSALSEIKKGQTQAAFFEAQAKQEQIASQREQRDLDVERRRRLAATRAALAAQGADLSSGSPLAVQRQQEREFATRGVRLSQDAGAARRSLLARARGERRAGFINAAGRVIGGSASLLRARNNETEE